MAAIAITTDSFGLLQAIEHTIQSKRLTSWSLNAAQELTLSSERWKDMACFRLWAEEGRLVFGLLHHDAFGMSNGLWGTYHGGLAEMLCIYFASRFTQLTLTATFKTPYDTIPA